MNYRMLSVAADDLALAIAFYDHQSAGLGQQFLHEFEAAVQRVLNCPEAWTSISPNQRRCLFRRFPHAVLYARDYEGIVITAVMDLRMGPEAVREKYRRI